MFTAKARRAQRKEKKIGHGLIQIKEFKNSGIEKKQDTDFSHSPDWKAPRTRISTDKCRGRKQDTRYKMLQVASYE